MTEARIWHEERKTQEWKEYYVLLQDGEKTISFILKHNNQTNAVVAEPYSPPDINYTLHDACDHENDECVLDDPDSSESEEVEMAERYKYAVRGLEEQVKQQRIAEKLLEDQKRKEHAK